MSAHRDLTSGKPLPFDTYSRFAVGVAYQAALRWKHRAVESGHLLFGLAQAAPELFPDGTAQRILRSVRGALESAGTNRERAIEPLRYSEDVELIFARARRTCFSSGGQAVGPAHLVPALRAQNDTVCAAVLADEAVVTQSVEPAVDSTSPRADPLGWLVLSDDSPAPYSAQLVDQIKDAVATGKLLPGQRLPALRQVAETLDLAPGTVAKAYRALDSEGIIETAGSKGTTVSFPAPDQEPSETRLDTLSQLLRPVAVAAFHMGGSYDELEAALHQAAAGVFAPPR